jgi:SH3 domain-containing YSC84-like protein 1
VGRDAAAQTDAALHAEMLSYSRSRGLFAGIALEGASLRPDKEADHELYGHDVTNREILTPPGVPAPAAARKLDHLLNANSAHV